LSANLPQFMYRDPARAYERTEGSTCQGCVFLLGVHMAGTVAPMCMKGKRVGVRCKLYIEDRGDWPKRGAP